MKHIMEILPSFRIIIGKLEEIKKEIVRLNNINDISQDARMVALDSIQIAISSVGMWIYCSNSLANECTNAGKFNVKKYLKLVGSGLSIEQTEEIMYSHLRLGFMTLVHFKIDNLFHNILKHMEVLPARQGYWNLTEKILEISEISKIGRKKEILTAFANLRNSLHGNGIHKTNSLRLILKGKNFDFIKDQRVECAGWEHILILLEANVDILKQILLSQQIVAINVEIKDDFASGI